MYQIKRNHIVEELQIEDNGKVLDLTVDINVDSILQAYTSAQYRIAKASQDAKMAAGDKDMSKAQEALGDAILGLFEVIFGTEQANKIIEFYGNKALEMLGDITPFITEVVAPRIKEAQDRIAERYKQVSKRGGK
jgi:hypothetical protein